MQPVTIADKQTSSDPATKVQHKRLVTIAGEHISGELIVKIHGWCNLACDYCYVYESPDKSWLQKPRKMTREIMARVAERIAEYVREHRLGFLRVVIHGGEPLLAGIDDIAYLVRACREAAPPDRTLIFGMQTNGTLLTAKILDALLELGVQVGVSLDGNERGNSHRLKRNGESSYEAVSRGLRLLNQDRYKSLRSGILGVVHLENDPIETYNHLAQYGVPIDFLWPLANWNQPPLSVTTGKPLYGQWMAKVFDHVYTNGTMPRSSVRLLDQLVLLVQAAVTGKTFPPEMGIDLVGPWTMSSIVVEVDGTFEGLDELKSTAAGEAFTGLNVWQHTITRALVELLQTAKQRGANVLPTPCQPCALQKICGGGHYPERYHSTGYDNQSVYCTDLTYLIRHIYEWLKEEVKKSHAAS